MKKKTGPILLALFNLIQITLQIPQYLLLESICIHLVILYVTQIWKTFIQILGVTEMQGEVKEISGPILQAASNFIQNKQLIIHCSRSISICTI